MTTTTPEQFNLFKYECQRWIDYFGLIDWKVLYEHSKCSSDSYAEMLVKGVNDRVVVLRFNSESSEINDRHEDIPKTAFHEVCELLTWPLEYLGTCRYVQPEEFPPARHVLIRILENTVYRDLKDTIRCEVKDKPKEASMPCGKKKGGKKPRGK